MAKRSVMVRVFVETEDSDEAITAAILGALTPEAGRIWTAIDHPTADGALQLWEHIERNPGGKGPATGRG